ncbi:MAG: endolytic transglycosylase MltG [Bacilli bacterium]|nr:endolytic transglycosylase MltG [Bacilli bacterium]
MKLKLWIKILIIVVATLIVLFLGALILYESNISAVSSKSVPVEFKIEKGTTPNGVIPKLKDKDLIKSEFFAKIYVKLNGVSSIHEGVYELNKNMNLKEIFETISDIKNKKANTSTITFHEGKNMRSYAKLIADNTKVTEEEFFNTLNDKEYLKTLINDYWFLSEEILNDSIYYSLEGYLAPDTYEFMKDEVTAKEIIKTLLDQESKVLDKYKDKISSSGFNLHEVLTLASIAELEGNELNDRKNIVGVFINRMNSNIPLGSDVTTYYGAKVNMGERDLYQAEIVDENAYNTRPYSSAGRLPVGPICNPSSEAIDAVINYTPNSYFYFVADKNGDMYFAETEDEHTDIIDELKEKGLWYEY